MTGVGAEWWGGRLADGSLVVLSPTGSALFLSDSSSPTGLQPGASRRKVSSVKEWLGVRSGFAIPYQKGGHVIGVRRGTLLFAGAFFFSILSAVTWLMEKYLHLEPFSALWTAATFLLGILSVPLALLLIYVIEVLPLKMRGVQFIDVEEDDDDHLRYVHPAVAETDEWGSLVQAAREHAPPSDNSARVHELLWETAGIKPTLDASEIRPADRDRLTENALLARGL